MAIQGEFAEVLQGYAGYLKEKGSSGMVIELRIQAIEKFLKYISGDGILEIREINDWVLEKYRDKLLVEKTTGNTKAIKFLVVRRFIEYLMESNRLLINPLERVERIKYVKEIKTEGLSNGEIEKILTLPKQKSNCGFRNYVILQILINTGIKRGELVGINVYDVDLSRGFIYVQNPANKKIRTVPINPEICRLISRYLLEIRPKQVKDEDERRLFLGKRGNSLTIEGLQHILKGYRDMSGIKKRFNCTTIRDSLAIRLLKEGKNKEDVSKILGHLHVGSTLRRYA